jgi:hypothetical protein
MKPKKIYCEQHNNSGISCNICAMFAMKNQTIDDFNSWLGSIEATDIAMRAISEFKNLDSIESVEICIAICTELAKGL